VDLDHGPHAQLSCPRATASPGPSHRLGGCRHRPGPASKSRSLPRARPGADPHRPPMRGRRRLSTSRADRLWGSCRAGRRSAHFGESVHLDFCTSPLSRSRGGSCDIARSGGIGECFEQGRLEFGRERSAIATDKKLDRARAAARPRRVRPRRKEGPCPGTKHGMARPDRLREPSPTNQTQQRRDLYGIIFQPT
jgi:hypothetical protein